MLMRPLLWGVGIAIVASVPSAAQTVVDRTLGTVDGRVIMQSDVRRARQLKLVDLHDGSDAAILTELQNRILILAQVGRAGQPDPRADDVQARRAEWEASLGSSETAAALLAQTGMSEADLATWLRDDVRIRKYLQQLFGRQADPQAAIDRWVLDLRRRAGLK